MIKWIGQHIVSLIARFRDDVYLESLDETAQDHVVGIDSSGKLYKQDVSTGDITSVRLKDEAGSHVTYAAGQATVEVVGSGAISTSLNGTTTITVTHNDTSSQASVDNSGSTVIQDVTLDTYGHVTGLTSKTIGKGDVNLGNVDDVSEATLTTNILATADKADVGLDNVDNTSDANKPISTLTQAALDAKAPTASPTFTGTVSGVTASMVGLGNVEDKSSATIRGEIVASDLPSSLSAQSIISSGTLGLTAAGDVEVYLDSNGDGSNNFSIYKTNPDTSQSAVLTLDESGDLAVTGKISSTFSNKGSSGDILVNDSGEIKVRTTSELKTDLSLNNVENKTSATIRGEIVSADIPNNAADTSGNAATATALATARNIAGVAFDGTANISLNNNAITNGAGYTTNTGDITRVKIATDDSLEREATSGNADFVLQGGEGIDTSQGSGGEIVISGELASTSNKGVAAFDNDHFIVTSGNVSIKDGGINLEDVGGAVTGTLPVSKGGTGNTSGQAATVATISGLAPDTATTAAAQPNITSLGTLTSGLNIGSASYTGDGVTVTGSDSDNTYDVFVGKRKYPRIRLIDDAATGDTEFEIWNLGDELRIGANASSHSNAALVIHDGNAGLVEVQDDLLINGEIQLGSASDTTISRTAAGKVSVEGGTGTIVVSSIDLGGTGDCIITRSAAGVIAVSGNDVDEKHIVTTHHNFFYDSTSTSAEHWFPFNSLNEDSGTGTYYTRMVSPYPGKLVKVMIRPTAGIGTSCTIQFYRITNTDADFGKTPSAAVTAVNLSTAETTVPVLFGGSGSDFTAGDVLGVSIQKNSTATANVQATCVWEYTV